MSNVNAEVWCRALKAARRQTIIWNNEDLRLNQLLETIYS